MQTCLLCSKILLHILYCNSLTANLIARTYPNVMEVYNSFNANSTTVLPLSIFYTRPFYFLLRWLVNISFSESIITISIFELCFFAVESEERELHLCISCPLSVNWSTWLATPHFVDPSLFPGICGCGTTNGWRNVQSIALLRTVATLFRKYYLQLLSSNLFT